MARKYTFDIDSLLEDLKRKPYYQNTEWGKKYGISRERVRQIREEYNLPSVIEGKKIYIRENFDDILKQARKGNFITKREVQILAKCSPKFFTHFLATNQSYADRYSLAIMEWEKSVYNPTHKICVSCNENKSIIDFYKTKSDGTRDGYARRCKVCIKKSVKNYYEIRKLKDKTIPDKKYCSAVPEVGLLPASEFHKMQSSNTGLQPQSAVFQDFFVKFRKENDAEQSRELARQATIEYYELYSVI